MSTFTVNDIDHWLLRSLRDSTLRHQYHELLRKYGMIHHMYYAYNDHEAYSGSINLIDISDVLSVYEHNNTNFFAIALTDRGPLLIDQLSRKCYFVACPAAMRERFDKTILDGLGILRPLVCTCGKHKR